MVNLEYILLLYSTYPALNGDIYTLLLLSMDNLDNRLITNAVL